MRDDDSPAIAPAGVTPGVIQSYGSERPMAWTARSRSGMSSSTVACKIACAVSKCLCARWSRVRAICLQGMDGWVARRSSGSALTGWADRTGRSGRGHDSGLDRNLVENCSV